MDRTPDVIVVSGTEQTISARQVRQLYDLVGWWPERTLPHIQAVLARGPTVGAWIADQLVGFARAVSDGYCRAYIEDVMVHPAYRRQGIGHTMMIRLLE
jgi:ribosomal protein S18 acetylase RimI-like enzyme